MLGLALLYFIGKYFYNLAALHQKHKWGFAILGIVAFYFGTFLFGIILEIILLFGFESSVQTMSNYVLSIISLPAGIGFAALVYHLLKKQWGKHTEVELELIAQIGDDIN